ncbi:MAG: recombination-associated protein RdgC [Desulfovibrionaceae bacterium]|nr:recombination-associated protein RdgC [Desulfovibrionaceae bacterium]
MGFANASCSFTRYRVLEHPSAELWAQLPALLKRYAFQDIDALPGEERSFGWTSFEDMLDTEWTMAPPEKGAYVTFALRLETRRVPPAVLKKHHAIALRDEKRRMAEQGKQFISRERKKELKEHVQLRLMRHFLPIPALFDVVWARDSGLVYFASIQRKILDIFEEYFVKCFELPLEQLTPYGLAAMSLTEHELNRLDTLESTSFT